MYCLEYLEANVDWLEAKLRANAGAYFLFDLPGQIELFTHHTSLRHILDKLTFKTTLRLAGNAGAPFASARQNVAL